MIELVRRLAASSSASSAASARHRAGTRHLPAVPPGCESRWDRVATRRLLANGTVRVVLGRRDTADTRPSSSQPQNCRSARFIGNSVENEVEGRVSRRLCCTHAAWHEVPVPKIATRPPVPGLHSKIFFASVRAVTYVGNDPQHRDRWRHAASGPIANATRNLPEANGTWTFGEIEKLPLR